MPLTISLASFESRPDIRTLTERLADVLAESYREDTNPEFRLGLLQGALAIAMPPLLKLEPTGVAVPKRNVPATRRHNRG